MAKKPAKTTAKKSFTDKVEQAKKDAPVSSFVPKTSKNKLESGKRGRSLVSSAPHFRFTEKGQTLECVVQSKIVPEDGDYAGKLIGWIVTELTTGEEIMIGNTHAIEKAMNTELETGKTVFESKVPVAITWVGKSELGNGKTFNNFDVALIEIED